MPSELLELPVNAPGQHILRYERGSEECEAMGMITDLYDRKQIELDDLVCLAFRMGYRMAMGTMGVKNG